MIYRVTRATRIFLFFLLVFFAVGLSLIRLSLMGVDEYKTDLEKKIYQLTSIPIKIGKLRANMRGINPEIVLNDIHVLATDEQGKPSIQLEQMRLGIDLMQLLLSRQVLPSIWLTLVGAKLSIVRKEDGRLSIVGLNSNNSEQPLWLLSGGRYELLKSDITWLDQKRHGVPLSFKEVDLLIKNDFDTQSHEVHLLSQLPERYGEKLRVSLLFQGNVFKANNVNGRSYIEGTAVHLAKLVGGDLPLGIKISTGKLEAKSESDFKLWSVWKNSKLETLTGEIKANNLTLHKDKKTFQISELDTLFDSANRPSGWQIGVAGFKLKTENKEWPIAGFSLSANQALTQLSAFVSQLDLGEMSVLFDFFAPLDKKSQTFLAKLKLTGLVKKTSVYADIENEQYAVDGAFEHVSMNAFASIPKIVNGTGTIKGSNESGRLQLNTKTASLFFPKIFRSPISIINLTGGVDWKQQADGLNIRSESLILDNKDIQTESKVSLIIPDNDESIFLDLHTSFANLPDLSHISKYLPVRKMKNKRVVSWLDKAFTAGKITQGRMAIYGELEHYPFIKNQGKLEVLFDVKGAELNYAPGWPHLKQLNAEVLFLNNSLAVDISDAKTEQLKINRATIKIPSLKKSPRLLVKGQVNGRISAGLDYLQKTPLHERVDVIKKVITTKGSSHVNLDLKIPLVKTALASVNGAAYFKNAELTVKAIDLNVTDLTGKLKIIESELFSDDLNAYTLGHPIHIKIEKEDLNTVINIGGKTDISLLQQQFTFLNNDMLTPEKLNGSTEYSVTLDLPTAENESAKLDIKSNLIGINSALPGVLKKGTEEEKQLLVSMLLDEEELLPLSIIFNDEAKAAINIDKQQSAVHSAHIFYGQLNPVNPTEKGVTIQIEQDNFDVSEWLGIVQGSTNNEQPSDLKLNKISLKTEQLRWNNGLYGDVEMTMQRVDEQWHGNLVSSIAQGSFVIPVEQTKGDKTKLEMETINLSALLAVQTLANEHEAEDMPLIDVSSEQLWWKSVNLGKLEIETEKRPDGVGFKHINVTAKDHEIKLKGNWFKTDKNSVTELSGDFISNDFGTFLTQIDMTDDIKKGHLKADFLAKWQGLPYQFSLSTVEATIDMKLKKGRISSIEPGFGRLLGLIAIKQWIKRLSLDFGDVFNKGLTFNEITGHFLLEKGKLTSHDLLVDAIPARIAISGEADLLAKTLDHKVQVLPKSSAAIPIAGTIVGGVAGAITQVFTSDYREGYFFGSEYIINGPWDNFKIIPLSEQDGILKKLTDFSWTNNSQLNSPQQNGNKSRRKKHKNKK